MRTKAWRAALLFVILMLSLALPAAAAPSTVRIYDNQTFTYKQFMANIERLAEAYPGQLYWETIGYSHWGQAIPAIRIGNPKSENTVLVHASIHAREYMTTQIAMKMIEDYLANPKRAYKKTTYGDILKNSCIWIVPLVNPDGVQLSMFDLQGITGTKQQLLLALNGGKTDFSQWKANGIGVDLNVNFARAENDFIEVAAAPGPYSYAGPFEQSEPENQALISLTLRVDPKMTLALHTRGNFMYWEAGTPTKLTAVNKKIALELASLSNYWLNSNDTGAMQGYRDWYVTALGRLGYTIEIGTQQYSAPQPIRLFDTNYSRSSLMAMHLAWRLIHQNPYA